MTQIITYKDNTEIIFATQFMDKIIQNYDNLGIPINSKIYFKNSIFLTFKNGDILKVMDLENFVSGENDLKTCYYDICFLSNQIYPEELSLLTENVNYINFKTMKIAY